MRVYKVYSSVLEINELPGLHNDPTIAAHVKAKSLREAMQKFYGSKECQKFVEKYIYFNSIHFYFENEDGKIIYYHRWLDL